MMRKKQNLVWAVLLFISVSLKTTYGDTLDPVMDRHLVKQAELIFEGQVLEINFKSSTPREEEEVAIPHSFVTFQINNILKGKAESDKIILRFQGGRVGLDTPRTLRVSGIPLFDIGDYGIFFVRSNEVHICPLVGWRQGFIRILDNAVYSDYGHELRLFEEPLFAAAIHPHDILDYEAFSKQLLEPTREIDQIINRNLADETKLLMRNPDAVKEIDPQLLGIRSVLLREERAGLFQQLMPPDALQICQDFRQFLLIRDFNVMLTQRNLFSLDSIMNQAELSPQTIELLQNDQQKLNIEQIALLNRRVLEDLYPSFLLKSLDQTIGYGPYNEIAEFRTQHISQTYRHLVSSEDQKNEGPATEPDPLPTGSVLDLKSCISQLNDLILYVHTREELERLSPVQSADIEKEFYSTIPPPMQVSFDLSMPQSTQATEEEMLELRLLEESGGNPVLKR
ncbi:MAG: hypothetical protein C4527_15275 [Candidatus Omnitrophota bacterium]|jgi:hypothetical protein|nr:MAG: hypothetical protein C4527_15275 [Candidatus Omnitrophota bacterium]